MRQKCLKITLFNSLENLKMLEKKKKKHNIKIEIFKVHKNDFAVLCKYVSYIIRNI